MQAHQQNKPLVALLDGRNCAVEMPILKSYAIFAFCDAQAAGEIHNKVLNEASAALLWSTMTLTRDDLLKFKALKLIVRIGSSVDNIDVEAAGELGIAVSHIPGCCVDEMADSTMAMILNLYRGTIQLNAGVHDGRVPFTPEQTADACSKLRRIRGQTLGIIGFGRIGTAVAVRALAFGFKVLFYDPYVKEGIERSIGVQRSPNLPELYRNSDCVSLHCPFNVHTHRMINDGSLHNFKRGAFLVNTASGFLIDEMALTNALKEGILAGAALDVYESNCMNLPSPLLKDMPNLICTPRTAWYSDQSSREAREEAAQEVKRALLGRIPDSLLHCINKDLLIGTKLLRERSLPIPSSVVSGVPSSGVTSRTGVSQRSSVVSSGVIGAQPAASSLQHSTHLSSSIAAVAANQQQAPGEHAGGHTSRKRNSPHRQPSTATASAIGLPRPVSSTSHFPPASVVARLANPDIPFDAEDFYHPTTNSPQRLVTASPQMSLAGPLSASAAACRGPTTNPVFPSPSPMGAVHEGQVPARLPNEAPGEPNLQR